MVATLCCCRTFLLHKLLHGRNKIRDAKCLSVCNVQSETARVYPAINWVITRVTDSENPTTDNKFIEFNSVGLGLLFGQVLLICVSWTGTADLC